MPFKKFLKQNLVPCMYSINTAGQFSVFPWCSVNSLALCLELLSIPTQNKTNLLEC